ncbi:SusD family protein [compost metagenome]
MLTKIATTNFDLTPAETAGKDEFRTVIRKERSLELGYEGLRRFDLIRWGQFYSAMKNVANEITTTAPSDYKYAAKSGQNVSEKDTLFAIPAAELNLNKTLNQNKGW